MNDAIQLRRLRPDEFAAAAELVRDSTNAWYEAKHGRTPFPGPPEDCLVFPEVYEALDPGCCIVAEDTASGRLAGSCYFHPRETHFSLGIMNAHPDYAGRGVATRILDEVLRLADADAKPVRLVSSAMNLDSYSLYTRRGFVPRALFQDMVLPVPEGGLAIEAPPGRGRVRDATDADAASMAELEFELNGIRRESDYAHFIANASGYWGVSVIEAEGGGLDGFLCSVKSPSSKMLGPGVARTEGGALALIHAELDARHRGGAPVFLVPADRDELVAGLYAWGARNTELHVCQVRGECPPLRGVTLPTFMPETG